VDSTARKDLVREYLTELAQAGEFPGCAWWVARAGTAIHSGATGFAALEPEREPLSVATPFDLASLTKPLATAILTLDLERSGRLDLEAPAARFLPELAGSAYADVTLLELGRHEAGLPAWRPLYVTARTLEEYLAEIARTAPAGPRGASLYTDLGYVLLGAVVERAAGERLDTLFERGIAAPLGLARCGFARTATGRFADAAATERGNEYERGLARDAGRGYAFRTGVLRGQVHDGNAAALGGVAGHAGLFGTVEDVARIAAEILVPRATPWGGHRREALLQPARSSGARTFGFVLARESGAARGALPDQAPGHTGFTGTSLWLDPASEGVYVLLTNRVHPVVRAVDFQSVRHEFHRRAAQLLRES